MALSARISACSSAGYAPKNCALPSQHALSGVAIWIHGTSIGPGSQSADTPSGMPKAAADKGEGEADKEGKGKDVRETEQQFIRRFFQANPAPPPMFSLPLPFSGSPKFPPFSSPDGKGAPPPDVPPPPPVTYPMGHLPKKVPPLPMPELPAPQWPYG